MLKIPQYQGYKLDIGGFAASYALICVFKYSSIAFWTVELINLLNQINDEPVVLPYTVSK